MKFFIVDAFTDSVFGGNPAGVVILPDGEDFPSEEICIKTAAELRYSETAFIKKVGKNEFNIRYFTPAAEVDLCGHATIASFYCLAQTGEIENNALCINHTLAGDLNIEVKDGFIMMDMASPVLIDTIKDSEKLKELYNVMGAEVPENLEILPQLVSTGLPDIMLPLPSKEILDAINPDMKKLSDLSKAYNVTGVHAYALASCDATCYCRNFAPLYDIDEEAATGTSNGALTYHLFLNNIISGKSQCKMIQGEAMGRPSAILTVLDADEESCKIKVGGSGVILAEGDIRI